jgi:hypothetical protein
LNTERFGASPFTIRMLVAVYSGMEFIFSPIGEGLSDRAQTVISSPALASLVSSFKAQ